MMYSGPYGYDAAPIETLFSHLKLGNLNPQNEPTGKRSLEIVSKLVHDKLESIPRATRINYWHQTILQLYRYANLLPI